MRLSLAASIAIACAGVALCPAAAEAVRYRATGVVSGFEYNPAGAAAIYAAAPVGTAYTLDFGYDTSAVPLFSNASYAAYGPLPVDAVFTLTGYNASLPTLNVTVGDIGMGAGDQFQLFGNAAFSPTERLAGYQLVDLSFRLTDPTSSTFATPSFPSSFNLPGFASRLLSARFAFGGAGETRLLFSVDALTPLAAAVPEPASWSLLIVGFGLVGIAARRRSGAASHG